MSFPIFSTDTTLGTLFLSKQILETLLFSYFPRRYVCREKTARDRLGGLVIQVLWNEIKVCEDSSVSRHQAASLSLKTTFAAIHLHSCYMLYVARRHHSYADESRWLNTE